MSNVSNFKISKNQDFRNFRTSNNVNFDRLTFQHYEVMKFRNLKNSEIVYSENSSREALKISTTRARETGPVKPDGYYPESVSREAKNMSNIRSKKYTVPRKGLVYSAEMLKSMGRRPPIKNIPFKSESSALEKKEETNSNGD